MTEFPDKVRIVFKDLPLSFHKGALPAAEAARCAGDHGRFWEYHDLLFVAQPAFSRTDLESYAARVGLPAEAFAQCLDSGKHRDAALADAAEARGAGIRGTPTFIINGKRLVGAQPFEAFRDAIQQALNDAGATKP